MPSAAVHRDHVRRETSSRWVPIALWFRFVSLEGKLRNNGNRRVMPELHIRQETCQRPHDTDERPGVGPHIVNGRELRARTIEDGDAEFGSEYEQSQGEQQERARREVHPCVFCCLTDEGRYVFRVGVFCGRRAEPLADGGADKAETSRVAPERRSFPLVSRGGWRWGRC
jgi:hypothetical protein